MRSGRSASLDLSFQIAGHFELNGELVHREDFVSYLEALSRMDPDVCGDDGGGCAA